MPDENEYPPCGEDDWYALMEHAPVMFQSVGPDGRIGYVNRLWRVTLGYFPGETRGLTSADIVDPSCEGTCRSLFGEPIPGCGTEEVDAVFLTRDGQRVRVRGSTLCIIRDGRPAGSRGIFVPVRPECTAPGAGEGTAPCLDRLVAVLPLPVYRKDRGGMLVWVNSAFERITGKTAEEIPGMDAAGLVSPPFAGRLREMDEQLLATGGVQQFEGPVLLAGGIDRLVTFTQVACEEAPGDITGILGTFHEGPAAGAGVPAKKGAGEWCAVPGDTPR